MTNRTILSDVNGWTPVIDKMIPDVGLTTAAVFGRIWRYCQMKDGVCTASQSTIGDEIGLERDAINNHVEKLVKFGYLQKIQRPGHPCILVDTGKAGMRITVSADVNQDQGSMNKIHGDEINSYTGCIKKLQRDEINSYTKIDSKIQQERDIAQPSLLDQEQPQEPKQKMEKPKTEKTLTANQVMVGILSKVTGLDYNLKTNLTRLAKQAGDLVRAGYAPEFVEREYSTGGWWYSNDWRGKKDQRPTPEQVAQTIGQIGPGTQQVVSTTPQAGGLYF
jgi:hypothetical protein